MRGRQRSKLSLDNLPRHQVSSYKRMEDLEECPHVARPSVAIMAPWCSGPGWPWQRTSFKRRPCSARPPPPRSRRREHRIALATWSTSSTSAGPSASCGDTCPAHTNWAARTLWGTRRREDGHDAGYKKMKMLKMVTDVQIVQLFIRTVLVIKVTSPSSTIRSCGIKQQLIYQMFLCFDLDIFLKIVK